MPLLSNSVIQFNNPLQLATTTFLGETNETTVGWVRQKTRMLVASYNLTEFTSHGLFLSMEPLFSSGAGSPLQQRDAHPNAAKWQIITTNLIFRIS
mmetsp:Transcript_30395/g.46622  ORF Transcript_30395/g.46622 Transcript_30395/m.46622 type:complete len:96 (+) Transcript_30395:407-694(+)